MKEKICFDISNESFIMNANKKIEAYLYFLLISNKNINPAY